MPGGRLAAVWLPDAERRREIADTVVRCKIVVPAHPVFNH